VGPTNPPSIEDFDSPPAKEYAHRLDQRRCAKDQLARRERFVGFSRVFVGLSGLLVLLLAFGAHWLSGWWLVLPIGLYSILLFYHERVTRVWYRSQRAVAFY
jgi:hypothetical protein